MLVAPFNHQTGKEVWKNSQQQHTSMRLAIKKPRLIPLCHCKRQQLQVVELSTMTTVLLTLARVDLMTITLLT